MSDRQLCRATLLPDKVARFCRVSDMGLRDSIEQTDSVFFKH